MERDGGRARNRKKGPRIKGREPGSEADQHGKSGRRHQAGNLPNRPSDDCLLITGELQMSTIGAQKSAATVSGIGFVVTRRPPKF